MSTILSMHLAQSRLHQAARPDPEAGLDDPASKLIISIDSPNFNIWTLTFNALRMRWPAVARDSRTRMRTTSTSRNLQSRRPRLTVLFGASLLWSMLLPLLLVTTFL